MGEFDQRAYIGYLNVRRHEYYRVAEMEGVRTVEALMISKNLRVRVKATKILTRRL